MRILHLRSGQGIYGAETVLLGLSRACAARHTVVVGVLADARHEAEPALLAAARARGLEAVAVPVKGRLDPAAPWRIRALAKQWDVDVVHSHDYKSTIMATAGLVGTGRRHVATLHGDTGESKAVQLYERALYGVLPLLDAVATVSEGLLEKVRERAPRAVAAGKVKWIANGLDEAALAARVQRGRDAVRAELAAAAGQRLVLAVGRLSVEKHHVGLIEAAAGLGGDVVVAIAGDGPLKDELAAAARRVGVEGRLRLLGARGDVADLYRAADVLAHPSLTEGLPMVVLEAMASGLPVVASDVGEIARTVDAGAAAAAACGVVVQPGDVAALRDALAGVLAWSDGERAAFSARARRRVTDEFGVDAMARRYEAEIYGAGG